MATRLDRVTTTAHRGDAERDLAFLRRRQQQDVAQSTASPEVGSVRVGEAALRPSVLGGAMASWFALTFGICYVVLPALAAITGINPRLISTFWLDLPSFAIAAFVATVGVLVDRPRIELSRVSRDPVLAATLGGLGVWAVVHNVSATLQPFAEMTALQFGSLFAITLVETVMLGTMFASFTKRADVALALGGGFQLGVLGLLLTLMSLAI